MLTKERLIVLKPAFFINLIKLFIQWSKRNAVHGRKFYSTFLQTFSIMRLINFFARPWSKVKLSSSISKISMPYSFWHSTISFSTASGVRLLKNLPIAHMSWTVSAPVRTSPTCNDHRGSFLPYSIPIEIEQLSCRPRKGVEIWMKFWIGLIRIFSISPITNPVDLLNVFQSALPIFSNREGKRTSPSQRTTKSTKGLFRTPSGSQLTCAPPMATIFLLSQFLMICAIFSASPW